MVQYLLTFILNQQMVTNTFYYQSSHPHHMKVSLLYIQAVRFSRNCSSEKDFTAHIFKIKEWFLARGYPVVNDQIGKVVFGKNPPVKKSSENGIPFVATYHPKVTDLGQLIKDLLLFQDVEVVGAKFVET